MEKLKCRWYFCLLFTLLLALGSISTLKDVSATSLTTNTNDMWIDSIQYERGIYGSSSWNIYTASAPANTNALNWGFNITNMSAGNELSRLYIAYKSGPSTAALISFDISWTISSPNTAFIAYYNGLKFKPTTVLLNDSCANTAGVPIEDGTNIQYTFNCSYLVYVSRGKQAIDTEAGSYIFNAPGTNSTLTVRTGAASYVELTNDSLSASDKAWLQEHLPSGTSSADIESGIESARESEKEEYEDQAQDNEDTAEEESSAAQSTATSLLSVVGQFVGVLTSAQPTNCNLNGDLIPHLPLGNLDLCQLDPPPVIVIIGSLSLIAFVVSLSYFTVKRMLALIGSFQS